MPYSDRYSGFTGKLLLILKILFKTVLAFAIFISLWIGLTPLFRLNRNKEGDAFRNMPAHTLDVIAVGSSQMQYAFNPGVFYADTGLYSYVMGSPCQPFSQSYYMLQEVFQTQSPSVALIDVFTLLPDSQVCQADGMYYIAIDEMSGKNRMEAAQDAPVDEETKKSYEFDLLMNHDNWKNVDLKNLKEFFQNARPDTSYRNSELGYVRQQPDTVEMSLVWQYEVLQTIELTEEEKGWIDRIVSLCQEHECTPIFIKTPYTISQESFDKLNAVWTYIDSIGVRRVDDIARAQSLGWYTGQDGDTYHNTTWGSEIVTDDLADMISSQSLAGQNHVQNDVWDSMLADINHANSLSFFGVNQNNVINIDPYRLLKDAPKYPVITMIRYTGKSTTTLGDLENQLLQNAGFNKDFINDCSSDYYGVAINGKIVQESTEPFYLQYSDSIAMDLQADHMWVNGSYYDVTPGEMELYFVSTDGSFVNAVPIDYSSQYFWNKLCDGWSCTY